MSRRDAPADDRKDQGGCEGERRHAEGRGHDARVAVARAVDDDLAEAAAAGDGHRCGRNHEDGRDPDAGEDERQPERQLDAQQHLELRHPDAARRVHRIRVDPLHREVCVREDRRDREHDERDGVVPEADAQHGQAEGDEHEARQRAADVRDARGREETAVEVPEPEAGGQREQERDPQRSGRELEVSLRLREQQPVVIADEPEGVDERVHAVLPSLAHGVSPRWSSTSSPSATSASATAMPPAVKISVQKMSCSSATKIGLPEALRDDERRHRRDRDGRDGGDAETGEDRRQRERQLDAQERREAREAPSARDVDQLDGDVAQPLDDVPVEDEQRVRHERDLDRRHGDPGDRDEQLEEREATVYRKSEASPIGGSSSR